MLNDHGEIMLKSATLKACIRPQTQCTPTWQSTKGGQFISIDQQLSLAAVCQSKDSNLIIIGL